MKPVRFLIVALAAILVPSVAMATVNLDVVGGTYTEADAGTASASFESVVPIAAGTQWEIWTVIDTTLGLDTMQWALHANGGADNGKFNVVSYANGPLYGEVPVATFQGFGSAFSPVLLPDGNRFANSDLTKAIAPFGFGTTEFLISSGNNKPAASIDGKSLVGYIIENTVELTGQYDISVNGPSQGAVSAIWTGTPEFGTLTGSAYTIRVVPEPTSALLLLAAVPFLRRRRA